MTASPQLEALAAPLRDLSRWNRLLSLPSDRRSGYLTFFEPVRSVWATLAGGGAVSVSDPALTFRDDWSSDQGGLCDGQVVRARLDRLDGLSHDIGEETGVSPLALALGLVLWRHGTRLRCAPLMHCPMVLEGG